MKERPILFSAPMVQAILAGNKTQTRRVVKMPDYGAWDFKDLCWPKSGFPKHQLENFGALFRADKSRWIADDKPFHGFSVCPYGQIGDQLWVRETWGYFDPDGTGQDYESPACAKSSIYMMHEDNSCLLDYWLRRIAYKASFKLPEYGNGPDAPKKWHPSIHMPRWASRITLEITNIRVERLQDISDDDSLSEGVDRTNTSIHGYAKFRFQRLWEKINGKDSWTANPWVWVIEFRRI